jgi:uncharacterized protein YbjT (DUF2867 family)
VLVTGATGNVGSQVVRELRGRGIPVRAFVRDPEKAGDVDVAIGDFADAASIRRALESVDRVFLSSGDGPDKPAHEAAVVDASAAAGVELIVKASTLGADPGSPLPALAWNGRSEGHLRRSGVPAVVLQSSFYMTNLLAAAEQVRHSGQLMAPAGDGRVAMIDPRDVAAVAAAVLAGDGHAGRTYRLTGPDAITYERVAAELGRAAGSEVRFVDVPEDAAREGLIAAGMPDWLVQQLVGAFRLIREDALVAVTDTVRVLTGRDARGFAEFATDHAALFRPTAVRS